MEVGRSLFDLGGLPYDLEILLGLPVDGVSQKGLKKGLFWKHGDTLKRSPDQEA